MTHTKAITCTASALLAIAAMLPSAAMAWGHTYRCVAEIPGRAPIVQEVTAIDLVHAHNEFLDALLNQGITFSPGSTFSCSRV